MVPPYGNIRAISLLSRGTLNRNARESRARKIVEDLPSVETNQRNA